MQDDKTTIGVPPVPFVTIERYAQLTGLSTDAVKQLVKRGLVPTYTLPQSETGTGKRVKKYINILALHVEIINDLDKQESEKK